MGKYRCLSCKSEFELDDRAPIMRCERCGCRFVEVVEAENRKRGKSWSAKSFSVGKSS
ncbi:MAG: hydrogenase maturation nickel metallochaperone HypA [Synergistaceae bacterium]|nr:hydrogenase expression protein HypA/HybF [Synergistota bacterium]NLM72296.1 hydrogenase maturation nickel metallochaperone HypA [Synergistaceae bacterium]